MSLRLFHALFADTKNPRRFAWQMTPEPCKAAVSPATAQPGGTLDLLTFTQLKLYVWL